MQQVAAHHQCLSGEIEEAEKSRFTLKAKLEALQQESATSAINRDFVARRIDNLKQAAFEEIMTKGTEMQKLLMGPKATELSDTKTELRKLDIQLEAAQLNLTRMNRRLEDYRQQCLDAEISSTLGQEVEELKRQLEQATNCYEKLNDSTSHQQLEEQLVMMHFELAEVQEANDALEAESVSRTNEKNLQEQQLKQLKMETRALENRQNAQKLRLARILKDLSQN